MRWDKSHCYLFYALLTVFCCSNTGEAQNVQSQLVDSLDALSADLLGKLHDDPKWVISHARLGLVASDKAGYQKGVGRFQSRLAQAHNVLGLFDSARFFYGKAIESRLEARDTLLASNSCLEISYVFQNLGISDSSYKYLLKCLRLREAIKDEEAIIKAQLELASLSIDYEDYLKAEQSLVFVASTLADSNDSLMQFRLNSAYGRLRLAQGEFREALVYFEGAESWSKTLGSTYFSALIVNYKAAAHEGMKQYGPSLKLYRSAAKLFEELEMSHDACIARFNVGNLYLAIGQKDSAEIFLTDAENCARAIGDLFQLKQVLESIVELKIWQRDFESATAIQFEVQALNDSILNAEKISSISEMQTRYETEKKEQQIKLLDEQSRTRKAQRNAFVAGTVVFGLGLIILAMIFLQRRRVTRKNEQIAQQQIQKLMSDQEVKTYNAMIEGQEEERKRIAADLHDRLGSMLSTVKLMFGTLDEKVDRAQASNQRQFQNMSELLDDAVIEVRRISHNLNTGMVASFGLVAAMEDLCESIDQNTNIKCKLLYYGMEDRLERSIEIGVYRMIQEVFNNTIKHAKATAITVQLNRTLDSLSVTVEDDGVGFNASKVTSSGMGFKNLESRAARLGGSYHIDSAPGHGSISIIEIPLNSEEDA